MPVLVDENGVTDTLQHGSRHPELSGAGFPFFRQLDAIADGGELQFQQPFSEFLQVGAAVHHDGQRGSPRDPHLRVLHRAQVCVNGFFFHS